MGSSVLRIFAGLLASAAVSGAFICAVAVVKPGAGPAPTWPAAKTVPAKALPMPRVEPGPAASAASFTPVLTPAPVATVRVTAPARPRVKATTPSPTQKTTPATTPAAAAPSQPTPEPTSQAAAPASVTTPVTPEAKPAPDLVQQVRTSAGQTVSAATRGTAKAVSPFSPPLAGTVAQTGDTLGAVVSGG